MNKYDLNSGDEVIVDGTTGTIAHLYDDGRALLTWSDENGMQLTKKVWQKRCEVLVKYGDK